MNTSERSIRRHICTLKDQKYIDVIVVRDDNNEVVERIIKVRQIDYKLPPDKNVQTSGQKCPNPPDKTGQNLRTELSYVNTHLKENSEREHAQEVFDLSDEIVERINNAPTPLERMVNSVHFKPKFQEMAQRIIKPNLMSECLDAMSSAMMTQKNYHRWYKSDSIIYSKFKKYIESPTDFKEYKQEWYLKSKA